MASLVSSREKPSSEPVTTTVSPARVCSTDSSRSSTIRTPSAAQRSTIATCHSLPGLSNQSRTDSAMTGPTPSTPASSSTRRLADALHRPEVLGQRARRRGADVADRQRHEDAPERLLLGLTRGCRRASAPLADSTRPVDDGILGVGLLRRPRVERARGRCPAAVEAEQGRLVSRGPRTRAGRPRPPSRGPRCRRRRARRRPNSRSRSWLGQDRALGHRMSLSPSFSEASVGAARRAVRRHDELALGAVAQVDDRPEDLGDDVAGLAQHDGVADEHALALDLVRVVQRGHRSTVDPATMTGSMTPNGVTRPVRPTLTWMSRSLVLTSSGGYLKAMAHRGRARGGAEPALHRDLVDLDDDAVDLVLDARGGARRSGRRSACTSSIVSSDAEVAADRQPPRLAAAS